MQIAETCWASTVGLLESRVSMKVCVVVRTKVNCRLSRPEFKARLQGEPTYLNLKGGGDKSMLVKQGAKEGVYFAVLQRLSDMVKAGLLEP